MARTGRPLPVRQPKMSVRPWLRPAGRSKILPWRDLTQTDRGHLLFRLADLVEQNAERLARLETTDSGKLLAETAVQTTYVGGYLPILCRAG